MLSRRKFLGQTSYGAGVVGLTQLLLPQLLARPALAATSRLPGIPTPESVIGFTIGTDYKLASYRQAVAYLRALAAASPMIKLIEVGETSGGNTMICAIISSAENIQNLDRFKEISRRLTLAEGVSDDEARALAKECRAVVYIDGGLHANEVAHAQHNIQLAYELVSNDDPETRKIRENTILLLNFANPDGMDIVNDWYMKNVGTPFELSPAPILYHVYAGHDNNRDSYMLNLKETRLIQGLQFREWFPVIQINHHQPAPFPARISIPPLAEPINPNIHPLLTRWKNVMGTMMGAAFDRNNQPGAISRTLIDGWAPDMFDSVGDLFHTMSCSPETAGYGRYATPSFHKREDFPEEYRDLTPSIFYPNPWKGGWWRLKDAVEYVKTCSLSALYTATVFREDLLFDKYRMGKDTIARFSNDASFAWVIPQAQWDAPVAALMLNRMMMTGVKVCSAKRPFEHDKIKYPAGTWVVPMQHAFAEFVKTMFEEQKYPDMSKYPALWQGLVNTQKFPNATSQPSDMAGWTLPYQMGVNVIPVRGALKADLAPIDSAVARPGTLSASDTPEIVLSATANNSFIAISRLLKTGAKVARAAKPLRVGGKTLPPGSWIVRPASSDRSILSAIARDLSVDIVGLPSLAGIEGFAVSAPRVGLYQSWVASMDEGWTRYLLEQHEVPFTRVRDAEIRAGALDTKYDVLVIPNNRVDAIMNGHKPGKMRPDYVGGITEAGLSNIRTFVEKGGSLILLNGACSLALEKFQLPLKDVLSGLRPKEHDFYSDGSEEVAERKFFCPGSLLHIAFDPTHPLAFGMPETGTAQFASESLAFELVDGGGSSKPTVVAHYPTGNLLRSGLLKGGEYLNNKAAAVEVRLGQGRVILYGFGVQRRAQPHQTFKLLFNAIYQGASSAIKDPLA